MDIEKIFENLKYEYKLSSHITRFNKIVENKKKFVVRIKMNDNLSKLNFILNFY